MGFLHKLWDETLAGPAPESGLGKLRKYNSLTVSRSTADPVLPDPVPVSRTITVLRNNSSQMPKVNVPADSGSGPASPAGSSTPTTPHSPNAPGGNFRKLTRRKSIPASFRQGETRSPSGYDWCNSPLQTPVIYT